MTNIFFYFISIAAELSSYFHVCLLSAVRYLITVYPLQSRQHLTVTAVCLCSPTIWMASIAAGVVYLTLEKSDITFSIQICIIILDVVLLLIVCFILILLHVQKIRTLQKSLSVTDRSQRRMNIVATVIVSIFVLLQLSLISEEILTLLYIQLFSDELLHYSRYMHFCYISIGFLNFSCNPYLLFFHNLSKALH